MNVIHAQNTELKGKVIGSGDVEGIHILNVTQSIYSTTDLKGEFIIPVKVNDTISISSIKYEIESIVINNTHIKNKSIEINLKDKINELDEVVVGKVLTGDLSSDIKNTKVKDEINFYDVGIPGYTGPQMTQNERRLYDADSGKYFYFYGIAASVNIYKILNKISGRTKRLKRIVAEERLDRFILRIRDLHLEALFDDTKLSEQQIAEFFYFCGDDSEFVVWCNNRSDIEVFEKLQKKLTIYKDNLKN
ncbi:carboxypeptidase-like regulatory domain-containing protein [Ichthyenterobacterium sp. W332]|uniref:Carboxypeptidase-like regulatory domain-containing protein n=1 Tax=Microcosmobacter mediterraneus TaxID=3075607 RepID=A0ABU2YJK3_9FLAO|nr:carboxypeptidase-like regulatory domain-containing protein [Ichthyenterobacterium sp. W332]MDT0558350.1 carboxypeptidase-like regulatory domain-containing protein [Ichthyenterobacterium sp. W332]